MTPVLLGLGVWYLIAGVVLRLLGPPSSLVSNEATLKGKIDRCLAQTVIWLLSPIIGPLLLVFFVFLGVFAGIGWLLGGAK